MADEVKGWCWKCRAFQPASNPICIECEAERPIRKGEPWTWQGAVFLTVLTAIVFGAVFGVYTFFRGSEVRQEDPPPAPLFGVLAVIAESPSAVEGILGPAVEVLPIENVPENMPGEFRDYVVPGIPERVNVRFFRNRAVFVTVFLPEGWSSAQTALLRVGVDLRAVPADTRAPAAVWWRNRTIEGKNLEKIGAFRGMTGQGNDFDMVQAELKTGA